MISPEGFAIKPRMPAKLADLLRAAAGAGVGHHENRIEARHRNFSCPCSSVTFSDPRSRNISSAIRSVTSAQISTTLL